MGVWRDRLQWGFSVGRAGFVFLADCAPAHVIFGEFFHSFAFIGLAKEVCHVQDSGMTCKQVIVVQSENFASLFEIFGELDLGEA